MSKPSGGDGIPAGLFKILKDGVVKLLWKTYQQIWKAQQRPQDQKMSFFHCNPKEGQYQRMLMLPYNCIQFTCQKINAQKPSSQVSAVHELRTCRCISWIQKRHKNLRSYCQHLLDHTESKEFHKNIYFSFIDYLNPLFGSQ